jgi:hypothetical protein
MDSYIQKSFKNKAKIEESTICGCYYCKKIIDKEKIEYLEEKDGQETALCPNCMIDSVITDKDVEDNKELTVELLTEINKFAFGTLNKHEAEAINRIM